MYNGSDSNTSAHTRFAKRLRDQFQLAGVAGPDTGVAVPIACAQTIDSELDSAESVGRIVSSQLVEWTCAHALAHDL